MINLEKIKKEKCQPPLLRGPAPAPYFHPFSLIFQIPLFSGGGNQNLLPALPSFKTKKRVCIIQYIAPGASIS